ncbi:MAG: nucleoside recognition domain-containing protein, partial [Thauera sp.]|jgi:ferrous iron transport protein B|nr:nucleoside recognition domain-containing protein [Thauera sp.]
VLAFLAPVFFGEVALAVTLAFIGVNLLLVAVAGSLFNRSLFRGKRVFFIMEMPLYHVPSVRTIGRFVRRHVIAFLRNAGSLILIFSVVLWALAYFPGEGLEQSWLGRFGQGIAPVSELLGLDWRLIVALLASFVAKENAIAALGILYGIEGEGQALAEVLSASIPVGSALAFLTATMLFIPCVATLVVMRTETGSWRWPMVSVALHLALSIVGAMVVYWGWMALAAA